MLRWGNAHKFESHHNTLFLSLYHNNPLSFAISLSFNAENSHSDAKRKPGHANYFQRNMYSEKGEICHNGKESVIA